MASNQKWRSYGGLNNFETNNHASFNNLSVGNLSIKNDYMGYFSINGPLSVSEYANIQGNVSIKGQTTIYGGTNVQGLSTFSNDLTVAGNLIINKSVTINGQINIGYGFIFDNDINVNGNIGLAGSYIFMGPKNILSNYGKLVCNTITNEKFMGINQPIETQKILPGAMFEIYCDVSNSAGITALHAHSNNAKPAQSIIISNSESQGTFFYVDPSQCSMYMFNDQKYPTNTTIDSTGYRYTQPGLMNVNSTPDNEISYQTGGNMLLRVKNRTFISSKTIVGQAGVFATNFIDSSLNEKMTIYTDPSNVHNFNDSYYETDENYKTNNGLTLIHNADVSGSNVGLNLVTKNTLTGMKLCGGTYILDLSKSMGSIGLNDDGSGGFIPVQTMVTSNNPAYRRTALGINTYAPNMDNYSLNVNGKTLITEGEITKIQDVSFQIYGLVTCTRDPSYITGYGTPIVTTIDPSNIKSVHPYIYSHDSGSSWSIGDISGTISSEIHKTLLSANYVHSYNSTFSVAAYEGNHNYLYTANGGETWQIFVTDNSNSITTTTIRALDMSASVMLAYTDVRDSNVNYMVYGTMNSIAQIDASFSADTPGAGKSLKTTFFTIPSGTVTAMDAYDASYIFLTGSFGISKYRINPTLGTINPVGTYYDIGNDYNALYTYKTYTNGVLNADPLYTIFVGYGRITVTRNGGASYSTQSIPGNLQNVYTYDISRSMVVGTLDGSGVIYITWDAGTTWVNMSSNPIFAASGVSNLLFGTGKDLMSICIPSIDHFLINRVDSTYVSGSGGILGASKVFYCHFPNVFNLVNHTVLDICGSLFVDGYAKITNDLTILGAISSSGNVIIDQNGGDSYNINTGTLRLPNHCGASISGNVTIGGNIVCGNITSASTTNISSYTGNIFMGTSSGITASSNGQTITIGNKSSTVKTDNIYIGGKSLYFDVSSVTGFNFDLNNIVASNATNVTLGYTKGVGGGGINFYDTCNNSIDPSHNLIVAGMNLTTDGSGFVFWSPYLNSKKTRLDVYNLSLGNTIKTGIVTLKPSPYFDSSYVICNQPNIDISNLILTTAVNAINNVQTIATDVSINGNLYISNGLTVNNANGSGVIQITNTSYDSYSTNTGSLRLNGGIGLKGNLFTSGNINISSTINSTGTGVGALVVSGGVGIGSNLYVGNGLTVDGSYAYFNGIYFNAKNGLGTTRLSMTDFSSNVLFHSTTDATGTDSGSMVVSGGAGIAGNVFIGRNISANGTLHTNGDCSFNGNVYITRGNIYLGNVFFGQDETQLSLTDFISNAVFHSVTESTGTDSGSIVVFGGVGIAGNVFVGNSVYFGSQKTHLSMTDFSSNVLFHSTTDATGTGSGSIVVSGGAGIAGNIFVGNSVYFGSQKTHLSMTDFSSNVFFHSTSNAISTSSGSVVVSGGVGVVGNLYLGGGMTVDGSYAYFNGIYFNAKNGLGPTQLSMTDFSSNVLFHSTTDATGTDSGSIVVSGGVGIAGNVFVGNSVYFGSQKTHLSMTDFSSNVVFHSTTNTIGTGSGSVVVSGGIGVGGNLYLGSGLTVDGSYAYLNAIYFNSKNGLGPTRLSMTDFSSNMVIYSTANTTGTASGALTVRGGVGVSGSLYLGGGLTVDGTNTYFNTVYINRSGMGGPTVLSMTDFSSNVTFYSTTDSVGTGSGSIVVSGGAGIRGNIYVGKNGYILGTVDSINTSTGALVVSGGIGIRGNVYANGYNGGTTSSSSIINLGRTVCYSLNCLNNIDICGGTLTISSGIPGTNVGGSIYLNGSSGLYSGGSIYCANTTDATSSSLSTNAAMRVVGGTIIGGNLFVGGSINAPVVNQTSDYRIKTDVHEIETDSRCFVDQLRPVKYRNLLTRRDEIGFVAHEVQEVFPFLVQGEKDGEDYQSVNYTGLIGILVKEIKLLKQRLASVEKQLEI